MNFPDFKIYELPNLVKTDMIQKGVWRGGCPVKMEQLSLLELSHYDFNLETKTGQMVAHSKMAENIVRIFENLYRLKFPINKIGLMEQYHGNDLLSMQDNNSSCFNYRNIAGSTLISMHSLGLAIDINPIQNPCISINEDNWTATIEPKYGVSFLNRTNQRPGMVEPIVAIFKKYGFNVWGGDWNSPLDYHHFQIDRKESHHFITN